MNSAQMDRNSLNLHLTFRVQQQSKETKQGRSMWITFYIFYSALVLLQTRPVCSRTTAICSSGVLTITFFFSFCCNLKADGPSQWARLIRQREHIVHWTGARCAEATTDSQLLSFTPSPCAGKLSARTMSDAAVWVAGLPELKPDWLLDEMAPLMA